VQDSPGSLQPAGSGARPRGDADARARGRSAEDIDKAMELGYNHRWVRSKLTDLVGSTSGWAIAEYLHQRLQEPQFEPPQILRDKSPRGSWAEDGKGFYRLERLRRFADPQALVMSLPLRARADLGTYRLRRDGGVVGGPVFPGLVVAIDDGRKRSWG